MSAADGVDARARRVAARLLSARSRRAGGPGSDRREPPPDVARRPGPGHPAGVARLARALALLESEGWVTLPAVPRPGAREGGRIDHLLVGPGGVVVVDSRPWVGRIEVSRGVVQQNGFWREREIAAVARTAGSVGALLPPRHRTAVHAVVCVVHHDLVEQVVAPGVHVVGVAGLGAALRSLPVRLDPGQVHDVVDLLRRSLLDGPLPEELTTAELDALPTADLLPGAHREPAGAHGAVPGGAAGLFVPTSGAVLRTAARSAARRRRPPRPWWRNPRVLVPRALLAVSLLVGALLAGPGLVRAIGADLGGAPSATVAPASSAPAATVSELPSPAASPSADASASATPSPAASPAAGASGVPSAVVSPRR